MATSEENTGIHFGYMFSFFKILLHNYIFPCVSVPTFFWGNYGQQMNIRQENETSEICFFKDCISRNKMDDFHCTSLVINGIRAITDS